MRMNLKIIFFFLLLSGYKIVIAQEICHFNLREDWFHTMLDAQRAGNRCTQNNLFIDRLWSFLRKNFRSNKDLQEMSWEERDKIWDIKKNEDNLPEELCRNYLKAYKVSCNERGVRPHYKETNFHSFDAVMAMRNCYLASRKKEYVILTPPPPSSPSINGPSVLGVRPGHPVFYKIPFTGEKPVKISISGLPPGCHFDEKLAIITGTVYIVGNYKLIINARNNKGSDLKVFMLKIGDQIALTPPLGWNSWNCFGSNVTSSNIRAAAGSMVKSGLINYGWSYVSIDDCWMNRPAASDPVFSINESISKKFLSKEKLRSKLKRNRFDENDLTGKVFDRNGGILPNKDFPDLRQLTNFIHSLGLKAGIYASPGPVTCQNYIGCYQHEEACAKEFAQWGFDYLKYDWCGYSWINSGRSAETLEPPYRKMADALKEVNRDIVFSICEYGWGNVEEWGRKTGGNLWRTSSDIRDTWPSLVNVGFSLSEKGKYAGPGHWNDPDMLVVGFLGWGSELRPTYLSPNEQYSHISLWCLLSAPLIIGADLTRLDTFTTSLLSNKEVLNIDQDTLGQSARCVSDSAGIQVWLKKLSDGSTAAGIFNMGDVPVKYKLTFSSFGLNGAFQIRDLWKQQNIRKHASYYRSNINRHAVKLLKLIPLAN